MLKKLAAAICLLGLCVGFLCYNIDLGLPTPVITAPTTPAPAPGQVRFINKDPSLQAAWESIAAAYTQQTGTQVLIIPESQAAGITPTLFTVADESELEDVAEVCLDLAGVKATHHLDWSLTLYHGKKMCGLPMQVEGYGLIYNAELLRSAGQTPGDITSFAKLKEVAQHISSTSALKYATFAGFDTSTSAMALLSSMPGDIRPFVDLYLSNTAGVAITAEENGAQQEILEGAAVFCIGSTQEYGMFSTLSESALNIMPLYIGMAGETQQGLCVRVESYWCVRNDVPDQDVVATLDFLDYLLHPIDGTVPVDNLGVFTPYTTATYYSSPLEKTMREHIHDGKKLVVFSQITAPEGFEQALTAYATDPTDENWASVAALLQ